MMLEKLEFPVVFGHEYSMFKIKNIAQLLAPNAVTLNFTKDHRLHLEMYLTSLRDGRFIKYKYAM